MDLTSKPEKETNSSKVEYFTKWVNMYQGRLGLINYDVTVIGEYMDERGAVRVDEEGRLATISYSIEWISSPSTTSMDINRTAFHEIAELCLNKIRVMLERYYSFEVVKEIIHDIIIRLENTLWKGWVTPCIKHEELPYIPAKDIKKEVL